MLGAQVVSFGGVGGQVEQLVLGKWSGSESKFHVGSPLCIVALEFPIPHAETVASALAVILLDQVIASGGLGVTEQRVDAIHTIEACVVRQLGAGECSEACGTVDGTDESVGESGLDAAGPAGDERGPRATFHHIVFAAAKGAIGIMAAEFIDGIVLVSIIEDWSIVTAEQDECVIGDANMIERLEELSDAPVEFEDCITAWSERRLSLKSFVWYPWHVDVMGGEKQEEWLGAVLFDPISGLVNPAIGEIFVAKASGSASGIKADPADAVVNGSIVAMRPIHLQGFTVGDSGWMIVAWLFIANPQWIVGVEIEYAMIADIDLRYAIIGRRKQETMIEPDFERTWFE